MRAADLRHVGDLLEKIQTSDSGAPEYGAWTLRHENVRAAILPTRGSTVNELGYEQDRVFADIVIRYRDGVSNRMRFRQKGNLGGTVDYDVVTVRDAIPDRPRMWLRLTCVRAEDTDGA